MTSMRCVSQDVLRPITHSTGVAQLSSTGTLRKDAVRRGRRLTRPKPQSARAPRTRPRCCCSCPIKQLLVRARNAPMLFMGSFYHSCLLHIYLVVDRQPSRAQAPRAPQARSAGGREKVSRWRGICQPRRRWRGGGPRAAPERARAAPRRRRAWRPRVTTLNERTCVGLFKSVSSPGGRLRLPSRGKHVAGELTGLYGYLPTPIVKNITSLKKYPRTVKV